MLERRLKERNRRFPLSLSLASFVVRGSQSVDPSLNAGKLVYIISTLEISLLNRGCVSI